MSHVHHPLTPGPLADDPHRRGFAGLVGTQFFGAFNDNFFRWLAVPLAQQVLGSAAAIAIGAFCLTFPYLLFTPAAGWLADRYPKRRVIVACKVAELAIVALGFAAIAWGTVEALFAVVVLLGAQSALFGPAKFGSVPELLPARLLSKGNGVMGMCSIVAIGLGTILGFVVYDWTRPQLGAGDLAALWPTGSILFAVSIAGLLCSWQIPEIAAADPQRPPAFNPLRELRPALRLLRADRRLWRTAWGIAFFFFLASLAQQAIDPFGEQVLGLGKSDVGLLLGLLIAGVGAGSLLAGYWSDGKIELGIVPLGALGMACSALLVFLSGVWMDAAAPAKEQMAYWSACVGLFLLGASAGLYDVPLEAYLQYRSERRTRGAVLAASFFLSYVLIVASAGVFYLLGGVAGLPAHLIFMLASLITAPVVGYLIWLLPDFTFRFVLWLISHTLYRLRVYGRDHLPEQGGGLVVANHVSFADGALMCTASSRFMRFVIYADFTEMPLLRPLGRIMRVIPIKPEGSPKDLVRSLNTAREAILSGELVCIFAEGALTRTGQMQTFQRGMLKIVQGTDAPIIPVYMHGLWNSIFSWRGGRVFWKWPIQWRIPVDIHFGPPILHARDAAHVRQEVERLGAEAVTMATRTQLIPVRKFIRQCKSFRGDSKVADSAKTSLGGRKLLAAALAFRRALRRNVFRPGEKQVGVLLPPSVGGCLANMALSLDKRVGVNLNYTLSEDVLNCCIRKAQIKHVLTSRRFIEKKPYELENAEFVFLEDLKQQVTAVDRILGAIGAYLLPAFLLDRVLGLQRISPDDLLTIVFTSGSTGDPKGVMLSHANIGSNIEAVDHLLNLQQKDGVLGVLPFFHSFGYTACLWLPMCYKLRGVYHYNPLDAKVVGELCEKHRLTIMMATPTFLKMYLKRCEKSNFSTVDLIVVGAEKLPTELARQFEERFGVLPTEGYGATELSPVAAVNVPDHRSPAIYQQGTKLGTVGRPLPGVTAKVVDAETGDDLGVGREGLLWIRGPNVMRGYLDEPDKTDEVLVGSWYCTGDFASLDADGFITITGRQSRFSKIAGEMVPHVRVEQELMRICEVPDDEEGKPIVAVTAVPDEDRGERLIVLYTQLCRPADQIVKELAKTGMPKLWLPSADSFFQVDEIPVLGTGKIDLRGLKDAALQLSAEPQLAGRDSAAS